MVALLFYFSSFFETSFGWKWIYLVALLGSEMGLLFEIHSYRERNLTTLVVDLVPRKLVFEKHNLWLCCLKAWFIIFSLSLVSLLLPYFLDQEILKHRS